MTRCMLALLLCCSASAFAAQKTPIYRCGQTYTQTPCPEGHMIESSDPRTAAQRAEARRVAEKEKRMAAQAKAASAAAGAGQPGAAEAAPAGKKDTKTAKASKAASAPGVVFITPRPATK